MNNFLGTVKPFILMGLICLAVFTIIACPNSNTPVKPPDSSDPFDPDPDPGTNTDPDPDDEYPPARTFTIEGTSSFKISWEAVEGASSYDISRGPTRLSKNYEFLTTVSSPEYTDASPNPNRYENYYRIDAKDDADAIISTQFISWELFIFGPNIKFYDIAYDDMTDIAADINRIHDNETFGSVQQGDGRYGEFSSKRYAMYFKPGTYPQPLLKIGFNTHFAGLGDLPTKTIFSGSGNIETPTFLPDNRATRTFWRSIENLQYGTTPASGSTTGTGGTLRWAVAQAAPMRRLYVTRPTQLDWNSGYASGGYTADCRFTGGYGSGSQQQWYTRNTHLQSAMSGVNWNKTLQGMSGQDTAADITCSGARTLIPTTPLIREKPFLYWDENAGDYRIFVPALRKEAVGPSWTFDDMGEGTALDLDQFYFTRPGDTSASINAALDSGKHIFFTPGIYYVNRPVHVKRADTIILGTGYATLIPATQNIYGALYVDDVPGVTVASLMFDASDSNSIYLMCVGEMGANKDHSNAPTLLADIVMRPGGYFFGPTHADISLMINSNNVIGDHFWLWRANIGPVESLLGDTIKGIGWEINTTKNGLVVTGDDVTVYGLFVEHYHNYNTLWMGERGRMYFYQNETAYDIDKQDNWLSHNGEVNGWAMYKVANEVNEHLAVGLGMYAVFTRVGETVRLDNAVEVPNKPGVVIINACTVNISGNAGPRGNIQSIVNGAGPASVSGNATAQRILRYEDGAASGGTGPSTGNQPTDEEHLTWLGGKSLVP